MISAFAQVLDLAYTEYWSNALIQVWFLRTPVNAVYTVIGQTLQRKEF